MADVRDPHRDQPLPTGGHQPVQAVLIAALTERTEYGRRKYGTPLMTHNGRDALTDAWEEALDLLTYLTQMRLERGDILPTTDVTPAKRAMDPVHILGIEAERSDPTQCSGQEGFCPEHGFHRHSLKQPAAGAEADRIVAYRSPLPGALSLYCTRHADELGAYTPLTSDDLPDGGLCVRCGADVLIPREQSRG